MDSPNEQEIAKRAYTIWEREGYPHGRSIEHWLTAERELNASHKVVAGSFSTENDPARGDERARQAAGRNQKSKVVIPKSKKR